MEKVAFIAHSFHKKTHSFDFLINYLREFFEVEEFYDEEWETGKKIDWSNFDSKYKAIVIGQMFPREDNYRTITNKNIVFFPMWDHVSRWNINDWLKCKDTKIICFSKKNYEQLKQLNFDVEYLQFFIEPKEFIGGDVHNVFFWQRHKKININTIRKIFGNQKINLHIHKSIDPGQEYICPSEKDEKKYNITYSTWFDSKDEMKEFCKDKGIYIAPRFQEGIGMSFLEAMSQGKVVIAHNESTMNEYIKNEKTGYLLNFKFPLKIKLNDEKLLEIQKDTYNYCKAGYEKYLSDRHIIIDKIKEAKIETRLSQKVKFLVFLSLFDRKKFIRLKFGHNASITILGKTLKFYKE